MALKFKMAGEKLRGSWVLVRMKHDRLCAKRNSWLLIKHRDEFAREGDSKPVPRRGPEGTSLIIHAGKCDYKDRPTGEAGGRIACGLIRR
jgi:Copper/zinc superoxide dismutase (SODC)